MPKKKFTWADTEDIAFLLIDKYPSIDPTRLSLTDIAKRVSSLPTFGGGTAKPKSETLESIQKSWYDERIDMEDELGPLVHEPEEGDNLDEDEYRDDRMIDDESSSLGLDDDDDEEEEDELGDGFHEEEVAD